MLTYSALVIMTAFGFLLIVCAVVMLRRANQLEREWEDGTWFFIGFLTFFGLSFGFFFPLATFIANGVATSEDLDALAKACPAIRQELVTRTDPLKHREALARYIRCIKDEN